MPAAELSFATQQSLSANLFFSKRAMTPNKFKKKTTRTQPRQWFLDIALNSL